MVHIDDMRECWCCGQLIEHHTLCPGCKEAGCNRFGDECLSDHVPVSQSGSMEE